MSDLEGTKSLSITFSALLEEVPGAIAPLSKSERVVYNMLKKAEGKMVLQDSIFDALYFKRPWNDQPGIDVVKVFITNLRKKMPSVTIKSHRQLGYSMKSKEDAE